MGPLGSILMWRKPGNWATRAKALPSQSWTMVSIKCLFMTLLTAFEAKNSLHLFNLFQYSTLWTAVTKFWSNSPFRHRLSAPGPGIELCECNIAFASYCTGEAGVYDARWIYRDSRYIRRRWQRQVLSKQLHVSLRPPLRMRQLAELSNDNAHCAVQAQRQADLSRAEIMPG